MSSSNRKTCRFPNGFPCGLGALRTGGRGGGLVRGLPAAGVPGDQQVPVGVPAVDLLGHRLIEVPRVRQELAGGQAHEFGAVGVEPTGEGVELAAQVVVEVHVRARAEGFRGQVTDRADRGQVGGEVSGVVEESADRDPDRRGGGGVAVAG